MTMNGKSRAIALAALIAGMGGMHAAGVLAQDGWQPQRGVEIIVTTGPGGANDRVARVVQRIVRQQKLVPVPFEVINKPGGNQTVALAYLNQYASNPHYLLVANPTLLGSHISGISQLNHTDFSPIALLMSEHTVLTVPVDSAITNAQDLFGRLRADPEAVTFGLAARAGPSHLALSAAAKVAGVEPRKLKTVIFKSNAESLAAMAGGHIGAVASTVSSALGQVSGGKARILGIVAAKRMGGAMAQVPTLREQGIEVTQASWRAVFGAKSIPAQAVGYWEGVLAQVVATEDWKKTLEHYSWAGTFLKGRELGAYLEQSYRDIRAGMTDLGLAK
jgi:putative tricarboxylic transport membrane protein